MAYGWRGEGLSSEGEPERMRFASRADSIGRTYQDDSERSSRRKANEAETGWSQPAHKPQTRPPRQRSSLREFLCRIWYLCWNLTKFGDYTRSFQLPNTWAESYARTLSMEISGLFKHPLTVSSRPLQTRSFLSGRTK